MMSLFSNSNNRIFLFPPFPYFLLCVVLAQTSQLVKKLGLYDMSYVPSKSKVITVKAN